MQNREEAEDMTQETYVKALTHIQKGNTKIEKYISYLKIVSLNVIRDRWPNISTMYKNAVHENQGVEDIFRLKA